MYIHMHMFRWSLKYIRLIFPRFDTLWPWTFILWLHKQQKNCVVVQLLFNIAQWSGEARFATPASLSFSVPRLINYFSASLTHLLRTLCACALIWFRICWFAYVSLRAKTSLLNSNLRSFAKRENVIDSLIDFFSSDKSLSWSTHNIICMSTDKDPIKVRGGKPPT